MAVDIWANKWFRELDTVEKCLWLYLNSRPVDSNGEIKITEGQLIKAVGSTAFTIERMLKKFGNLRIKKHKEKPDTYVMVNKKNKLKGEAVGSFTRWFDEVYAKYPKKIGRTEGYIRLSNMLMSQDQRIDFEKAIDNYNLYLKAEAVPDKYIKHFTSFIGTTDKPSWTDWLYWEPKGVSGKPQTEADNAIDMAFERAFNVKR